MLIRNNCELILASTSEIRKKILLESALKFETAIPEFDEEQAKKKFSLQNSVSKTGKKNLHFNSSFSAKKLAIFLAEGKALSISKKFPNACVIGSDQVCEFGEMEIAKSKNLEEAISQLKKFNGKIHFQNNATVVAINGKISFRNFSRVKMEMRKMSEKEIEDYVNCDQPFGCAGSYKYESLGKHLFEKVSGDYYAVLGLVIQPLLAFLHKRKLISFG